MLNRGLGRGQATRQTLTPGGVINVESLIEHGEDKDEQVPGARKISESVARPDRRMGGFIRRR